MGRCYKLGRQIRVKLLDVVLKVLGTKNGRPAINLLIYAERTRACMCAHS